MSVVQTTVSRAKPGRRHDVIALAVEAAKLFERHGAGESRLLSAGLAGEATGSWIFTTEFANGEAWGAWSDRLNADSETEALLDRVTDDTSPIVMESTSIGIDIPLGRAAVAGRGHVVEAHVSRVKPGRFEGALELANVAFDFLEANGAVGCRLMQLQDAGMMSECLVASWEFEDSRTAGKMADAYFSDLAAQPVLQLMMGADSPITTVTSGMYSEVPI
jgi:hypothetical protein